MLKGNGMCHHMYTGPLSLGDTPWQEMRFLCIIVRGAAIICLFYDLVITAEATTNDRSRCEQERLTVRLATGNNSTACMS